MGVGERRTTDKAGKVKRSRTITVLVDTGERYPSGAKKYKKIVRSLGSVHTVTKTEAKEVYEKEQSKYKRKKSLAFSPTLADFASRYVVHKRDAEGKRSWQRDIYSLNNLLSYFGTDIKLSEIESKHIDEYKTDRQKAASKKTVNNELGCLRSLFNLARIWGEYEGDNPVSKAGLIKKIVQDKKKPPSVEEEALLLSRLNPNISWIFRFAANTGMRISEIINLEVDQIQERQYFEDGKVKTIEVAILNPTDTKTGEARTIPLNDDAKAAKDEALAFNAGRYKQIFLNTQGKPYVTRQAVFLAMKRACKNLGIRRITPHDLRRRFASRLVESGANLIDVRDMMGHTSFKMLEGYVTTSTSKIKAVQAIQDNSTQKRKKKMS